jgi:hypothetical protein
MVSEIKPILTLGSCLSANIAIQMQEINCLFARISSVQHNRIDQFLSVHLHNEFPKLQKSDLNFELLPAYRGVNVIDNQIKGFGFGRSLPNKKDQLPLIDPVVAIDSSKIKICIFDDYSEIFFKIYKHNTKQTPFFINEKYLDRKAENFTFQNELLSSEKAFESYRETCSWISKRNRNICFIFVPFPVNLKKSSFVDKRASEFDKTYEELSKKIPNCFIFPREEITEADLSKPADVYHFNDKRYFNYAQDIINKLDFQISY